ncbi:MAG: DciA family protein [Thiohalocapsa sp.]
MGELHPKRQRDRVAATSRESERRAGLRPIAGAAGRLAGPIVDGGGGVLLARLKAQWPAIVGAELAAIAWPQALARDGALKLRVMPTAALELQHRAPLLIERINLFFGRGVVTRLLFVQGPLPLPPAPPAPLPPPPLPPAEEAALARRVADVTDPQLREALGALGRMLLTATRGG